MGHSSRKRLLSWFAILALVLSAIPFPSVATSTTVCSHYSDAQDEDQQASNQIVNTGGTTQYYNAAGEQVDSKQDALVAVSKSVAATGKENLFKITLDVSTTYEIQKVTVSEDIATVLVLDVSGSMDWCSACGEEFKSNGWCKGNPSHKESDVGTRLKKAKDAALDFLETYRNSAYNESTEQWSQRWVSIVTFAYNGTVVRDWIEIGQNATNYQTVRGVISNPNLKANGGTNMEAGLLLARNLLRTDLAASKPGLLNALNANANVILLSDGAANLYATSGDNQDENISNIDYSVSNMNISENIPQAEARAKHRAEQIKDSTSFVARTKEAYWFFGTYYTYTPGTFNKVKASLYTIAYGEDADATWLKDHIASSANHHKNAQTGENLQLAFQQIALDIKFSSYPWSVIDPMGKHMRWDADRNAGLSHIEYDENDTLIWNLYEANEDPTAYRDDEDEWRHFSLTYYVELDTAASEFVPETPYMTNGKTMLHFAVKTEEAGSALIRYEKEIIDIPKVQGYLGNFNFLKEGADGKRLDGYSFFLGEPGSIPPSVSNSNGEVSFEGIPSGHTYTLLESTTPNPHGDEYDIDPTEYDVVVSYGQTFIFIKDADGTAANVLAHFDAGGGQICGETFTHVNPYISLDIPIKKQVIKQSGFPTTTFYFGLFRSDGAGNRIGDLLDGTFTPIEVPAGNTAGFTGKISVPADQLVEIAGSGSVGLKFIIAELDTNGNVLSGTTVGEWEYAAPREITITSDRVIRFGNNNQSTATPSNRITFKNKFTKHYPLNVRYYLDGEVVASPVLPSSLLPYVGKFAPGESLGPDAVAEDYYAPISLAGYSSLLFEKGNLTHGTTAGEYADSVSDTQDIVEDFVMPKADAYLNLYYRTRSTPNVTITKAFETPHYDVQDKEPPTGIFTFILTTDVPGNNEVARVTGLTGLGENQSGTFVFNDDWDVGLDFPVTLYLHEIDLPAGWAPVFTNGDAYVELDQYYLEEYLFDGVASNKYTQPPEDATFDVTKVFDRVLFGDDEVAEAFFREHYAAEDNFTFRFSLEKLGDNEDYAPTGLTAGITLTGAELQTLIGETAAPITRTLSFTILADEGDVGGTYRLVEEAHTHPGWGQADPVLINVNEFGRVLTHDATMTNTYGKPVIPRLTIVKLFRNLRGQSNLPSEQFSFEIATSSEFAEADVVERVWLSSVGVPYATTTVYLNGYVTEEAPPELYVREVVPDDEDEIFYSRRVYTLTFDEETGEYRPARGAMVFKNIYKETLYPSFTVVKEINKTFDEPQTFDFKWEVQQMPVTLMAEGDEGPETLTDTFTITIDAGATSASKNVDLSNYLSLANYSGGITVSEIIPEPASPGWKYDEEERSLSYEEGEALEGGTVVFRNNYYTPTINVTKKSNVDSAIRNFQRVTYTITITAAGSSESLTGIVINDSALGGSVAGLDLKLQLVPKDVTNPDDFITLLEGTHYSFDDASGEISLINQDLALGQQILVTYGLVLSTDDESYLNKVDVSAKGAESDFDVEDDATNEVELKDSDVTPHVDKQVALLEGEPGGSDYGGLGYDYDLYNIGASDHVVFRIQLWATMDSEYGQPTEEYEFSDVLRLNGVDENLTEAIALANSGALTPEEGKYYINLPVNGDAITLYYVYELPDIPATGTTITNTAKLGDQTSTAVIDTDGLDAGLRVTKEVAAYDANASLEDHDFANSVSFNSAGRQAIFRVSITSDLAIEITGLGDVFDGVPVDSVLVWDWDTGKLVDELLENLIDDAIVHSESDLVFYYVSEPLNTNNKVYRNTATVDWKYGAYYGEASDSATARTSWDVPPPGGDDEYDPVNFSVTVNYYKDGTTDKLADSFILSRLAGSDYDVTLETELEIEGFERVLVDGIVSGVLRSNVVINVYYDEVTEIPDDDVPGGDVDPQPEVKPDEGEEIPDEEIPGGGEIPSAGGFVDTAVLLGAGTLMILMGVFFLLRGRKKENLNSSK